MNKRSHGAGSINMAKARAGEGEIRGHLGGCLTFRSFSLELSFGQNLDLILTTRRRILAPRMNRLTGLKVQRPFKGNLGAKMFDCVFCSHDFEV